MVTKTCWKCCCQIYADEFPAHIDGWTVVAGTVVHDTDHMELQTAGALVVSDETSADEAYYVRMQFQCPEANKTLRVLVDYQDADNYLALQVEFHFSGNQTRLQLVRRSGGADTNIGGSATIPTDAGPDIDELFDVVVCFAADGHLIGNLTPGGGSVDALTTSTGGDRVGVLLVDETDLEVHLVDWQRHGDEKEGCPRCALFCLACNGEWTIAIAGIADAGDCNNCNELLNGTFVLPQHCGCTWRLPLGAIDACGDATQEVTPTSCDLPIDTPYLELIVVRTGILFRIDVRYVRADGSIDWVWRFQLNIPHVPPFDTPCDELFNGRTLTKFQASTDCDDAAATVSASFAEAA